MLRSEGFRKYLRNTSWMFAEKVVRLVTVLITGIYVARFLGPELFGQFNYASGFVGLFMALTVMGMDEILVRDLVKHPERRDELLGSAALLKLCGAALLVLLASLVALAKGMDQLTIWLVVVIALAELSKPFVIIEFYFNAQVKASKPSQVLIVQALIGSAFKLALVAWQAPLIWFAWAYMVEGVVMAVGNLVIYSRIGASVRAWRATRATCGYLLQQMWPLLAFGIALFIQARIDQVMIFDVLRDRIGERAANAEVGQYSNALKMIEALGFLPVIVQKSLAPAITRARAQDPLLYEDRLLNQYRLMFLMFLVTAIPLYFLAEPIMVLLYGEAFRPAGVLLSLFAIRLFFTNMGVGKTSFITNESLFKYSLITAIVGAVLNIVMNYFLIPPFKSMGAIGATIGSFFISIFIMDLFFKETRRNFRWMVQGITSFWKIHRFS